MDHELMQKQQIRELLENWVLWRDQGAWERFRTCWHSDARMLATWFDGPAERFIEVSRQAFDRGITILHALGGSTIDVAQERAVAQTKMTISQRAAVEGVLCDVVCTGRFYDLLEERDGRWAIVLRRCIYDKDRIDPIEPGAALRLDATLLGAFPEGYRHLAYVQTKVGFQVRRDLPSLRGPVVERVYAMGAAWLAHRPIEVE
jgi:SnoaL-like protein